MKVLLLALSLLLLPCLVGAAEITVGWKMPVEVFAPDFPEGKGLRKLEKAPGKSTFFQPGDELWEISGVMMEQAVDQEDDQDPFDAPRVEKQRVLSKDKWAGEWLVWNARSGMIIARGVPADIFFAQSAIQVLKQPQLVRTKLEWVHGSAGKMQAVSLVARSGEKGTMDSPSWRIAVEPVLGVEAGIIDERITIAWTDGAAQWDLSTALTLRHGERTRVACQGSGEQRWELFLTAQCEYFTGVSISEVRWRETPDGVVCWPISFEGNQHEGSKTPEGLEIALYNVPNYMSRRPAAQNNTGQPTVQVPAAMAEIMRGEVVDIGDRLREQGVGMGAGSFAGLNPETDCLIFAGSETDHHLVKALIKELGHWVPTLWVETDPASGGWGIACRSGEKATILGESGDEELHFVIEPMVDANPILIDVHYRIDLIEKLESKGRLEAAATLHSGTPQVIASRTLPGQDEQTVTMTVRRNLPVPEKRDDARPLPDR